MVGVQVHTGTRIHWDGNQTFFCTKGRGGGESKQIPTCHVMVSMALTNQGRLRKGWKTPYAPYGEWNAFPARLKEGRKSVPALFKRAGNASGTPLCPLFFFRDGNIDKALVRPAVQWWVKGRSSLQRKIGLRPWTRLPWPCSIRKEHRTPLVERRRSGRASQKSRRREAWLECNFGKIGKGTDLHGRVVV